MRNYRKQILHVGKLASIAACCMRKLHATIAHETTAYKKHRVLLRERPGLYRLYSSLCLHYVPVSSQKLRNSSFVVGVIDRILEARSEKQRQRQSL